MRNPVGRRSQRGGSTIRTGLRVRMPFLQLHPLLFNNYLRCVVPERCCSSREHQGHPLTDAALQGQLTTPPPSHTSVRSLRPWRNLPRRCAAIRQSIFWLLRSAQSQGGLGPSIRRWPADPPSRFRIALCPTSNYALSSLLQPVASGKRVSTLDWSVSLAAATFKAFRCRLPGTALSVFLRPLAGALICPSAASS